MKIHPPKIDFLSPDLLENDLFNRNEFGESLMLLFQNIAESSVVCIDAPWGEGKTTFAKMWMQKLKNNNKKIIYYDAYENDFADDPFISFSAEIISFVDEYSKEDKKIKTLKKSFKKKVITIAKKLFTTGTKLSIKAITLGVIGDAEFDTFKSLKKELYSDSLDNSSEYIENKINNFKKEKNNIMNFKEELSQLGKLIKDIQDFPLLIIIDELDRCKPDFALMLIERIKHFFSVENVSFLILTNIKQLENYVKTIYGFEIDAHNYLHKFFTLTTYLSKNNLSGYGNDNLKFITHLSEHYGLIQQIEKVDSILSILFKHFKFSLRVFLPIPSKCLVKIYFRIIS